MNIQRNRRWLRRVCLTGIVLAGCNHTPANSGGNAVSEAPDPKASSNTMTVPAPAVTYDREAEVLLSTRNKERLTIAIDFAGTKAMNKTLPFAERRQYVAELALELYMKDFAKGEKPGQPVKVLALSVPNRDDYARGDFRNMDELAIFDTTHDLLLDTSKGSDERLGEIEWRSVLK